MVHTDSAGLLKAISPAKKASDSLAKNLSDLKNLEAKESVPPAKALQLLEKVGKDARAVLEARSAIEEVLAWCPLRRSHYEDELEDARRRFGHQLSVALGTTGMSIEGQYPDFRVGLFTIETDVNAGRVVLWYGPKAERLDTCEASADVVVARISVLRARLGSGLTAGEYQERLKETHTRLSQRLAASSVPIVQAMAEMAFLLQPSAFLADPRRENYRSYSRADFSFDLFSLPRPSALKLRGATRAETRRRQDFLWVPDSESGSGAAYSHIVFEED